MKFLPDVEVMFERIKAKDGRIDPTKGLDCEKYFELLIIWKKNFEQWHVQERPKFKRYRHKKSLETAKALR